MNTARATWVALAALAGCGAACGEQTPPPGREESWDFAATAYPTVIRGGGDYTSAVVTADHGALHLEGRYNYESVGARSAFVGWNLSGGDTLAWELTPMLGGAWGTTEAFVPGLEASLAWGRVDFYTEIEYVRHPDERKSSRYVYAWSELGFRPVPWLRLGAVAQRTRAYGGDRSVQAGPFAQVTWDRFTLGGYWFNAGSSDQVVVVSIGASF
ncbi:hypothetical protein [Variovorax sp.]|uniref:hypothetical protein n=1 Tax=Variovorax sp. TaxID=1871043 RepID=UPI002D2D29C5|nr:hypothetical protein [Variovorax sp.]HYP85037.1 hypothetical protein [Variovorax sp.]